MASEILEAEASKVELEETSFPTDRRVNHQLFNWITILLLTGWILVVGIAANTAQVGKPFAALTDKAFIRNLL